VAAGVSTVNTSMANYDTKSWNRPVTRVPRQVRKTYLGTRRARTTMLNDRCRSHDI